MDNTNQHKAPLVSALIRYAGQPAQRFHVPGHGGGKGAPADLSAITGPGVLAVDVTELPGLDDLNSPSGVIAEAQEMAAGAFDADKSFFLVNGTTQGLQALLLALAADRPGGKVILPRNGHRSLVGGLILAGLEPVFVTPAVVPGFNFAAGVPAAAVAQALKAHPGACAVLCVHPTYYGVTGNLKDIAGLAHRAGIPLLADEAHGPHLYFHSGYPEGALKSGADAAVQSMHKTGGSLTQSSLLHIKGRLLNGDRVAAAVRLIQTSSPSYVLMASLDAARRNMAANGREILQEVLAASERIRLDLAAVKGIDVFGPRCLDGDAVFDCDPARVVIRISGLGISGFQGARWLRQRHIYVEMADRDNIVLALPLGITAQDCLALTGAVREMAQREGKKNGLVSVSYNPANMPPARVVMKPRDAWFSCSRPEKLENSAGMICGEWVAVCPPGIPLVLPGEEISSDMVNYLIAAREDRAVIQGPEDPELKHIRVIDS